MAANRTPKELSRDLRYFFISNLLITNLLKRRILTPSNVTMSNTNDTKFPFQVKIFIFSVFLRQTHRVLINSVLVMFMMDSLQLPQKTAKMLFHAFKAFYGVSCIFTAIIADSYLGHFRQYYVYIFGMLATGHLTLLSSIEGWGFNAPWGLILGNIIIVFLIATLMPVFTPLVGDQFNLPAQTPALKKYFVFVYWVSNIGAILGTILSPILRRDIPICGSVNCFPLCFGSSYALVVVECVLMIVFMKKIIRKKVVYNNVVLNCFRAAFCAISTKIKTKEKREHWLDHAEIKFDKLFLDDMKKLRVIYMMLPVGIFFAMYTQQETTWLFQARKMNGDIGFYVIPPDQMYSMNPILCVALIPVFNYLIYPLCAKKNFLVTPLQRICIGVNFYTLSFIISAIIVHLLELQEPLAVEPKTCSLYLYNPNNCTLELKSNILNESVDSMDFKHLILDNIADSQKVLFNANCGEETGSSTVILQEKTHVGLFWTKNKELLYFTDSPDKSKNGNPVIRAISNTKTSVVLHFKKYTRQRNIKTENYQDNHKLVPGPYHFYVDESKDQFEFQLWQGGVYVILINEISEEKYVLKQLAITASNTMHMMWMIPQYFLGVVAEILMSISFMEFYYIEAPVSMKACLQAVGVLVFSMGDIMVLVIDPLLPFNKLSRNILIYIGITVITTIIYTLLSWKYKYAKQEIQAEDEK